MNIQQASSWLEEQKLSNVQKQDYRAKIRNISELEDFEIEIALNSIIHEIREKLTRPEPTFAELFDRSTRTRQSSRKETVTTNSDTSRHPKSKKKHSKPNRIG